MLSVLVFYLTRHSKRTAKDAVWKASKSSVIMPNRLQGLKDLKFLVGELKEVLADESHLRETLQIMSTIRLQINCEITIGRRGGSLRWPVHIIMLICYLLVNLTPPSDIPANIQNISSDLTGSVVNYLPSLVYVRKCRVVV